MRLVLLAQKSTMLCCNTDVMVFYVVRLSYECSVGGDLCAGGVFLGGEGPDYHNG